MISTVGERIRHYRKKLNLTQEEIAKKLNTSPQNIYKYEKGIVRNIPIDKINAMAELFGISPSVLAGWTEEKTPNVTPTPIPRPTLLSPTEELVIDMYRKKPETHSAIHCLLGIDDEPYDEYPQYLKLASNLPTIEEVARMQKEKEEAAKKK